jgi:hypothetical protein
MMRPGVIERAASDGPTHDMSGPTPTHSPVTHPARHSRKVGTESAADTSHDQPAARTECDLQDPSAIRRRVCAARAFGRVNTEHVSLPVPVPPCKLLINSCCVPVTQGNPLTVSGHSRAKPMKIGEPSVLGAIEPVAVDRPAAPPAASGSSKGLEASITLSPTARSREAAGMHPRFGELSAAAHRDKELAAQLAYNYGHIEVHQLVDLTDQIAGTGPMKYAATGEPVTAESEARFKAYAEEYQAASLTLYNEERAKGTSAGDIFDKLIALGDAQPAEFRAMMGWELRSAQTS